MKTTAMAKISWIAMGVRQDAAPSTKEKAKSIQ